MYFLKLIQSYLIFLSAHLFDNLSDYLSTPPPLRQLPYAPENPVALLSSSEKRAINLTWAKPFDGNSPLLRYILEVSENSE